MTCGYSLCRVRRLDAPLPLSAAQRASRKQERITKHERNEKIFSDANASKGRRVAAPYKDIKKQNSLCKGINPCNNPSVLASPSQLPCRGAILETALQNLNLPISHTASIYIKSPDRHYTVGTESVLQTHCLMAALSFLILLCVVGVFPVVPDVLNVVVILEHLEHLAHVLDIVLVLESCVA